MTNAFTSSIPICAAFALCSSVACSASTSMEAAPERTRAPMPNETERARVAEPTHSVPAGEPVQDRCVSPSCAESVVPEQPELEFLADMGEGWQRLVEMDWEVAAGAEGYRCKTFTVPEEIYVTGFAPRVPASTHHVAFDLTERPVRSDAVYACDVRTPGVHRVYGSGVGGIPHLLPEGVAMALRPGQQIHLNIHLFNPTETEREGRSGVWIKTLPPERVEQRAELVLVGPLELDIPRGRSTHTESCTVRSKATVFGVSPHMHFTGVHARATVSTASGEIVLHDGTFDPAETRYYPVEPLQLAPGDTMNVECTFLNQNDQTLVWGDSALAEMCFIDFSLYPALPYGNGPCTN